MKHLLKNRRGQGTTEYMVILAIIVFIALAFKGPIADAVTKKSKSIGNLILTGKE